MEGDVSTQRFRAESRAPRRGQLGSTPASGVGVVASHVVGRGDQCGSSSATHSSAEVVVTKRSDGYGCGAAAGAHAAFAAAGYGDPRSGRPCSTNAVAVGVVGGHIGGDGVGHSGSRVGLVGFYCCGCFLCGKKGGVLRLVFDCRTCNLCFHIPPKVALSTPAAIASISLHNLTCQELIPPTRTSSPSCWW